MALRILQISLLSVCPSSVLAYLAIGAPVVEKDGQFAAIGAIPRYLLVSFTVRIVLGGVCTCARNGGASAFNGGKSLDSSACATAKSKTL